MLSHGVPRELKVQAKVVVFFSFNESSSSFVVLGLLLCLRNFSHYNGSFFGSCEICSIHFWFKFVAVFNFVSFLHCFNNICIK
jgi:hypothetical protein